MKGGGSKQEQGDKNTTIKYRNSQKTKPKLLHISLCQEIWESRQEHMLYVLVHAVFMHILKIKL